MTIVLPFSHTGIEGWTYDIELQFLHDEAVRLASLVQGGLLEVGCWLGRSTAALAQADNVDVVDTFAGSPEINHTLGGRDQLEVFCANLSALGLGSRVHAYRGTSAHWLPNLAAHSYRLIFIDGDHTYETVATDLLWSLHLLAPGGTLAVDDLIPEFPGVQRAVREILDNKVTEVGKMGVYRALQI